MDYLNENYMYDLSMSEIAGYTGRSLATLQARLCQAERPDTAEVDHTPTPGGRTRTDNLGQEARERSLLRRGIQEPIPLFQGLQRGLRLRPHPLRTRHSHIDRQLPRNHSDAPPMPWSTPTAVEVSPCHEAKSCHTMTEGDEGVTKHVHTHDASLQVGAYPAIINYDTSSGHGTIL